MYMDQARNRVLGVGVMGAVIMQFADSGELWKSPGERFLEIPEVNFAYLTLANLVAQGYSERIHLFMVGDETARENTRRWFEHNNFFRGRIAARGRIHVCSSTDSQTAACLKAGITHFISSDPMLLNKMAGFVHKLMLLDPSGASSIKLDELTSEYVVPIKTWAEALKILVSN